MPDASPYSRASPDAVTAPFAYASQKPPPLGLENPLRTTCGQGFPAAAAPVAPGADVAAYQPVVHTSNATIQDGRERRKPGGCMVVRRSCPRPRQADARRAHSTGRRPPPPPPPNRPPSAAKRARDGAGWGRG